MAGRSIEANALARQPSSFLKGRWFRSTSKVLIATLSSASEKNWRLRSRATNPPLGQEHARLHGGFVTGMKRTCWQDCRSVVAGHLGIGRGRFGLVAARLLDCALQVIRHQERRNRPHELEGADVRADPVGQLLGPGRLGEGVVGRAQHGDEHLGAADLAAGRIDDRARCRRCSR